MFYGIIALAIGAVVWAAVLDTIEFRKDQWMREHIRRMTSERGPV